MKVWQKIKHVWGFLAGLAFSLTGLLQPGAAAITQDGMDGHGIEPKNRVARPEPFIPKSHEIAVENSRGIKSKGIVGIQPDGRFLGVITQEVLVAENKQFIKPEKSMESIPTSKDPKNKMWMHMMNLKDGKNFPAEIFDNRLFLTGDDGKKFPAEDGIYKTKDGQKIVVEGGIIKQMPAEKDGRWRGSPGLPAKDTSLKMTPASDKQSGKTKALKLTPAPDEVPGKDTSRRMTPAPDEQSGKTKALKLTPAPDEVPGKDTRLKMTPAPDKQSGKTKALKLTPALDEVPANDKSFTYNKKPEKMTPPPESRNRLPGANDPVTVILTDEDNEHLVFKNRDRVWFLNAEGFLECLLPEGKRLVIKEMGQVEVYSADNRLQSTFQNPRAEKMAQAMDITRQMKKNIEDISEKGEA